MPDIVSGLALRLYRTLSCSTQISMKFEQLIKAKMLKNKDYSCNGYQQIAEVVTSRQPVKLSHFNPCPAETESTLSPKVRPADQDLYFFLFCL